MWHGLPIRQELPDVQQAARRCVAGREPGAMERDPAGIEAETTAEADALLQRLRRGHRASKNKFAVLHGSLQGDSPEIATPAAILPDMWRFDNAPLCNGAVLFGVLRSQRAAYR